MVSKKPALSAKTQENKRFDYSIGDIGLNFTLRIDVKTQLVAFKEILGRALEDVTEEISKIDKKQ